MAYRTDRTHENPWDRLDEGPVEVERANRRWGLLVAGAIGFLLFGLTADPSLVVAVFWAKAGWDELRTARYLQRSDPNPVRGRVCARFYVASRFWKITMVAFCVFLFLGIIEQHLRVEPITDEDPPPSFVMTGLIVLTAGVGLSVMISNIAVASAVTNGARVWVGSGRNRARAVLGRAVVSDALILMAVSYELFEPLVPAKTRTPLFVCLLLSLPVGILILLDMLKRGVVAQSPEECVAPYPRNRARGPNPNDR
jgi:uncharacterized integral membrane protein